MWPDKKERKKQSSNRRVEIRQTKGNLEIKIKVETGERQVETSRPEKERNDQQLREEPGREKEDNREVEEETQTWMKGKTEKEGDKGIPPVWSLVEDVNKRKGDC